MTSRQKILKELWHGEPVPSWTISQKTMTADYRKRISEMRERGLDIESLIIGNRHYYQLLTPTHMIDFEKCAIRPECKADNQMILL